MRVKTWEATMALTAQQRDSIEATFLELVSSSAQRTAEVTQELVEHRWGDGAVANGPFKAGTVKRVAKSGTRAVLSVEAHYDLTRSEQDGDGPAEGHDQVELVVAVDDIDLEAPRATSFSFRSAKAWNS